MSLARSAFILLTAACALGPATGRLAAQAGTSRMARYEGTAIAAKNESNAGVAIDLLRWSTDEERDALESALQGGSQSLTEQLDNASTVGYIWTAESVGYSIRYAYHVSTAEGGEKIILALSEPFLTRNPTLWTSNPPEGQTYALIELRLDAEGHGEGRDVAPTAMAYAFGLDGFEAAAPLLEDLSRVD